MKYVIIVLLTLVGIYTEAQLIDAKHALRDIGSALQGSSRVVIVQKGCEKRPAIIQISDEELSASN